MTRCDRCDAPITPTDLAYYVWLWVVARINEQIEGGTWTDLAEAVDDVASRRASLPEHLVASDVYCRRSYLVCAACKERLVANPLGRAWGGTGTPDDRS